MNEKKFTKADLRDGHLVKFRSGELRAVCGVGDRGAMILTDGWKNWDYLSRWNDDLCYSHSTEDSKTMDIVAVYGYVQGTDNYNKAGVISEDHRPTLYKRIDPVKMTAAEISEEFGYPVEIIPEPDRVDLKHICHLTRDDSTTNHIKAFFEWCEHHPKEVSKVISI